MCFEATAQNTANLGNTALALQAMGALTSSTASYYKSKTDKSAYEYQAAVQKNAAGIDEWRAQDAIARGRVAEANQRMKTGAAASAQAARFSARGLALDEGSPLNVLTSTEYMGEVDANTIKDNTAREAWALRESAASSRSNAAILYARAKMERPGMSAFNSLLGSAGTVAGSWYKLRAKNYASLGE